MANPNDANIIVDGQKVVATVAQSGTVVKDGGEIDATSVIQTDSGLQKVVKVIDMNGGGGGGGGSTEQNIKAYHAPSATLDATLGVPIPNVDACTEQGLYNVDYSFESDGATITSNALLEVSEASMSGVSAITQNLLINVGTELVFCTRNYMSNTFTSWSGKNIPAELAKCVQNTATGTKSLTIAGNAASGNYCLNIGANSVAMNGGLAIGPSGAAVYQTCGVAIGAVSNSGQFAIGIGPNGGTVSGVTGNYAIQLGQGTNSVAKQFQVYTYPMLDGNTGLIPLERLGTGYDATKTQVLKHINGVATWVDE